MTGPPKMASQIWTIQSQIWPDFAKSETCQKSEIWNLRYDFRWLAGQIQICLGIMPNLRTNLDFVNIFSDLCQIPDLSLSTPKGVGNLPAKRGRVTTYPWAIFPDQSLGLTPIRRRRCTPPGNDRRRLSPEQPTKKETTYG